SVIGRSCSTRSPPSWTTRQGSRTRSRSSSPCWRVDDPAEGEAEGPTLSEGLGGGGPERKSEGRYAVPIKSVSKRERASPWSDPGDPMMAQPDRALSRFGTIDEAIDEATETRAIPPRCL